MIDSVLAYEDSPILMLLAAIAVVLALVISLSMHEFAHAYVAYKNGDDTAKLQGRLSLNPMKHMDWIGVLCCVLFGFGWAKPVPVNPMKFRNYKKGSALVSIAGVTVNLFFAIVFGGLYVMFLKHVAISNNLLFFLSEFSASMFSLNACLFVFNLLPIYPLDGFNLVAAFAKYDNRYVQFMQRYGNIVLIIILVAFNWLVSDLITLIMYPILRLWFLIL